MKKKQFVAVFAVLVALNVDLCHCDLGQTRQACTSTQFLDEETNTCVDCDPCPANYPIPSGCYSTFRLCCRKSDLLQKLIAGNPKCDRYAPVVVKKAPPEEVPIEVDDGDPTIQLGKHPTDDTPDGLKNVTVNGTSKESNSTVDKDRISKGSKSRDVTIGLVIVVVLLGAVVVVGIVVVILLLKKKGRQNGGENKVPESVALNQPPPDFDRRHEKGTPEGIHLIQPPPDFDRRHENGTLDGINSIRPPNRLCRSLSA